MTIRSNAVEDYLVIRKAMAAFSAKHNIVYQHHDARYKLTVAGADPGLLAEWFRLRDRLAFARDRLTPDELTYWLNTRNLCQAIGHFRHRRDVGLPRFICITCVCMFDADQSDPTLNIYGGEGAYMPGTIDPPPVELRKLP